MSFIPTVNTFIPSYAHSSLSRKEPVYRLFSASPLLFLFSADRENRTPDSSLARTRFTTKPYPLNCMMIAHFPCSLPARMCRVPPPGLEPGTTVPKTVVISISPREQLPIENTLYLHSLHYQTIILLQVEIFMERFRMKASMMHYARQFFHAIKINLFMLMISIVINDFEPGRNRICF